MQTIIGNATANAIINQTPDGRSVVNFTITQNDRFKVKGSNEVKQVTTFFDCSYWISTGIAAHIQKGMLIEVTGRIGVKVWQNKKGEPVGSLTFHVQAIQLHGKAKNNMAPTETPSPAAIVADDLPF